LSSLNFLEEYGVLGEALRSFVEEKRMKNAVNIAP